MNAMSDMNQNTPQQPAAKPGNGRAWRIVIGGAAVAVAAGVGVAAATTGGSVFYGPAMHAAMGSGGMGMGPGGMRGRMGAGFAERRFGAVMEEIEATPEQSERLRAIFTDARADLAPVAEQLHGLREEIAALVGAEQIDRQAAETLRAERVAEIDDASRRVVQAFLDAAEVLTPEQRAALLERFQERGGHRRW
jgi:Spy/CpxP family protein refolding chaperone